MTAHSNPILSIIIPTLDRQSLSRTLESIPESNSIEIILVGDGVIPLERKHNKIAILLPRTNDTGYTPRNVGVAMATGKWLAFMDDDNYYNSGGVDAMLEFCKNSSIPGLFKMNWINGSILWKEKKIQEGGIGLPQIVVPNIPPFPKFGTRYEADFDWMKEVIESKFYGMVSWEEHVALTCPKESKGI